MKSQDNIQSNSNLHAEENLQCRQIVSEISKFGVNQRQKKMIIYLLALELEDHEAMVNVCSIVRDAAFLIPEE